MVTVYWKWNLNPDSNTRETETSPLQLLITLITGMCMIL